MGATEYLTVRHLTIRYIATFFARVVFTEGGCWEWRGKVTAGEYGRAIFNKRSELTHRIMYAWLVGPLPRGIGRGIPQLDHIVCDNERCCNPLHMKLVSGRDNSLRSKGNPISENAAKTHCIRGHTLPAAPNSPGGTKRYCVTCSRDDATARRRDPQYRDHMRDYLREYHKARMSGQERELLLAKGRESARRHYLKKISGPYAEAFKAQGRARVRAWKVAKLNT